MGKYSIFFTLLLIIIFIVSIKSEKNCEDISPSQPSDCQLSTEDLNNYIYCCYEEDPAFDEKKCVPFNQSEYEREKFYYDLYKDIRPNEIFQCNKKISHPTPNSQKNQDQNSEINCEKITPLIKSDCILSNKDKKNNYKYCCFESAEDGTLNFCSPYTFDGYKNRYKMYENMIKKGLNYIFECNDYLTSYPSNCNNIEPKYDTDCKLSSTDMNNKYEYCCYEEFQNLKKCSAMTSQEYNKELNSYNTERLTFKCNTNSKASFSFQNETKNYSGNTNNNSPNTYGDTTSTTYGKSSYSILLNPFRLIFLIFILVFS